MKLKSFHSLHMLSSAWLISVQIQTGKTVWKVNTEQDRKDVWPVAVEAGCDREYFWLNWIKKKICKCLYYKSPPLIYLLPQLLSPSLYLFYRLFKSIQLFSDCVLFSSFNLFFLLWVMSEVDSSLFRSVERDQRFCYKLWDDWMSI